MKRGFTLIEIVIVLIIIALLTTSTMNLNNNFIKDVQFKKEKDEVMGDYQVAANHSLSSRYVATISGTQGYDWLKIKFVDGRSGVEYIYQTKSGEIVEGINQSYQNIIISGLQRNGTNVDELELFFTPYRVGCREGAGKEKGIAKFQVSSTIIGKKYCFQIHSISCKMISFLCEGEDAIRFFGN